MFYNYLLENNKAINTLENKNCCSLYNIEKCKKYIYLFYNIINFIKRTSYLNNIFENLEIKDEPKLNVNFNENYNYLIHLKNEYLLV